jgi:beta-phosphoglucomutase-like phosphatase (HAD superfamily)
MRAMIFDLEGTLVDTVYAHVLAWQRAFAEGGPGHRWVADPSADRPVKPS